MRRFKMALATHRRHIPPMAPGQETTGRAIAGPTTPRTGKWILSSTTIRQRRNPRQRDQTDKIRPRRRRGLRLNGPPGPLGDQPPTTAKSVFLSKARRTKISRLNRHPLTRQTAREVRRRRRRSGRQRRTLPIPPQRPNPASPVSLRAPDQRRRPRHRVWELGLRSPTCSRSRIAMRCQRMASWWRTMAQCWPRTVRCDSPHHTPLVTLPPSAQPNQTRPGPRC